MAKTKLIRSARPEVLQQAAEIIKLLGHPDRLKIVEVLEGGEASVSRIQEAVGLGQAAASQHLAKMRRSRIVAGRREGTHVYYRIVEPKVHHILTCIRTCDMDP